jgi:uroporphyrinogen-III decarboxylase
MPYIFRTDGWLWPLMEMIFGEIGCEGYGEIDAAAGMDLGEVRSKFPRLVFWGNVPCGTLLIHGTPDQVRAFARQCVEKTDGGRGLILGSSNCLAHGTPAENVLAMLEARES